MAVGDKDPGAFLTIGELSTDLGVPQHVLRYWESKFPQLKPLQRAGNRRYYRPADVELARRIHRLLSVEGYTIRGVQKLLRGGSPGPERIDEKPAEASAPESRETPSQAGGSVDFGRLVELRDRLASAIAG